MHPDWDQQLYQVSRLCDLPEQSSYIINLHIEAAVDLAPAMVINHDADTNEY